MAGNQQHGGARVGAGRKAKGPVLVKKFAAEQVLAGVNEMELWTGLLAAPDQRLRFDALRYLTDRRDGKAPQALDLNHKQETRVIVVDIPRPRRDEKETTQQG